MKYSNWLEFLMSLYWTQMNQSCGIKNANAIAKAPQHIRNEMARFILDYACTRVFPTNITVWGNNI
jgi:hypothetical protein